MNNSLYLASSIARRFEKALIVDDRWKLYFEGLGNTIIIALIAALIGTVIGVFFAMVNYVNKKTGKLKPLKAVADIYITIIRGTPVVLQLMILYFIVFSAWDNGLMIGAITFGINSGAYVPMTSSARIMMCCAGID